MVLGVHAVIVLAFTLPKAYELKKDEVDKFAAQAHHHTKVCMRPCVPLSVSLKGDRCWWGRGSLQGSLCYSPCKWLRLRVVFSMRLATSADVVRPTECLLPHLWNALSACFEHDPAWHRAAFVLRAFCAVVAVSHSL